MIRILTVAAALLLAACATYSDLQARAPTLDLTTDKTPEAYTACLAPKLLEIWPGNLTVIPDGAGRVLSVGAGPSMRVVIAVEQTGRVTLRQVASIGAYRRTKDATASCI